MTSSSVQGHRHLIFLCEDKSGEIMLTQLLKTHLGEISGLTTEIRAYRGLGNLPSGKISPSELKRQTLLNDLPRIVAGLTKSHSHHGASYQVVLVVICDLDNKDEHEFQMQLNSLLEKHTQSRLPTFSFLAIEEGEAWFLGDIEAVLAAYPNADRAILRRYEPDSICGTWEVLADAVHVGGSSELKKSDWVTQGKCKCEWATKITPHINIDRNQSPSFRKFGSFILNQKRELGIS